MHLEYMNMGPALGHLTMLSLVKQEGEDTILGRLAGHPNSRQRRQAVVPEQDHSCIHFNKLLDRTHRR